MARDFFKVEKGLALTGENTDVGIKVTFGAGLPTENMEVGSIYIDTDTGKQYQKQTVGTGSDTFVSMVDNAVFTQAVDGINAVILKKDGSVPMENDFAFSKAAFITGIPDVTFKVKLASFDPSKTYIVQIVSDSGATEADCVSLQDSAGVVVVTLKNQITGGNYFSNADVARIITTVLPSSPIIATLEGAVVDTQVGFAGMVAVAPYAQIKNLADGTLPTDASTKGQLDTEASRAVAAEGSLAQSISDEASRAAAAEDSLSQAIVSEVSRALAAEDSLSQVIASETSRAGAAEDSLSQAIANEASRASASEDSLAQAIAAEASRALAAEQSLAIAVGGGVGAEQSRAMAAEESLAQSILNEQTRAEFAESSLAQAISDEAFRAGSAESSLNQAILDEVSRAGGAESSLAQAISNETLRAQGAEDDLNTAIVNEVSRALAAEASLADSISSVVSSQIQTEISRAQAAEASLAQSISDEVLRAEAAELSLQGAVETKVSKAGDTMSGNLEMGGNKVKGLGVAVDATDAVSKYYVEQLIAQGGLFYNPILDPDLFDDSVSDPSGVTVHPGDIYIVAASPTGAFLNKAGHAMYYDGSAWHDLLGRAVAVGDRFGVAMEYTGAPTCPSLSGKQNQIAEITDATPGAIAYSFTTPTVGRAVYVGQETSTHFGHSYNWNGAEWVEFAGPGAVAAGLGLYWDASILNVKLGDGIVIDPSNALKLVLDGSVAASANLSMDGFKLQDVAAGTVSGDAVNFGQLSSLESSLSQSIANEVSRAQVAEGSLAQSVLDEASRAGAAELSLSQSIANEASRAQLAEGSLAQSVLDEASRAGNAEGSLAQSILDETSRSLAAESSLAQSIADEVTRAGIAEGSLAQSVLDEASRALAAESSLAQSIADEVTRAGIAESSLAQSILNEASRAGAVEASLAQSILDEVSRALAAEGVLTTDLANEISRAQAAEASLASAVGGGVGAETSRALAAESSLAQSILDEASRALAAESSLASMITSSGVTIGNDVNSGTAGSVLFVDGAGKLAQNNSGLYFDSANDRLGIGTISPQTPLHIEKNGAGDVVDLLIKNTDSSSSGGNQSRIRLTTYGDSSQGVVFGKTVFGGPYQGNAYFWNTENSAFMFATSNAEKMRLDASGNLGIGTTSPSAKLDVNGDAKLAGQLNMQSHKIVGLTDGVDLTDAVTVGQLNSALSGVDNSAFLKTDGTRAMLAALDMGTHAITNLAAGSSNTDAATYGQLYTEMTRAQAAESDLNTAILGEISRAQAAEGSLAQAIASEVSRAVAAENSVAQAVIDEASRAVAAENSVAQAVVDEASRAQAAEGSLNTAILAEISRAEAIEASLTLSVANEISRAQAAEGSLSLALAAEASRAQAMESSLQSQISFIASNTDPAAIDSLSELLAAYQAADGSLATAVNLLVNNEISRAQAAEGSLASAIANEVSRAAAAEGSLSLALASETSRAEAAEGSLASAIATEMSRAMAVESSLSAAIAAIPVAKHVAGPITTQAVVDSVSTKTTSAARWYVVARKVDNPSWVKAEEIFAAHDGTVSVDATTADFTQYAKLSVGTDFDVAYDVIITGSGAGQTMQLVASSTETNGIKISVTQVWLPDGAL